jgi:hypothetical protein
MNNPIEKDFTAAEAHINAQLIDEEEWAYLIGAVKDVKREIVRQRRSKGKSLTDKLKPVEWVLINLAVDKAKMDIVKQRSRGHKFFHP